MHQKLILKLIVFMTLIFLTACAGPQYETLLQTDSMVRYTYAVTEDARETVEEAANEHCAFVDKKAVYGKTFCDAKRCETSFLCE